MLTQKQLAKQLGVSQQAVSFALNGGGTLKQATREYIIEEAQKAGYRVNAASRLFREGKTQSIALIVHGNFHRLPGLMLSSLRPLLREREMHLTLFGAEPEDFADPGNPPRLVRELSVDGFLVLYDDMKRGQLSAQIAHYRIPSVWINQKLDRFAVYPDEFSISSRLVRELSARKKGHLLYFGPSGFPDSHYSVTERRDGFLKGLGEVGRVGEVFDAPSAGDEINDAARAILQRSRKRPKVVITYGKEDAQAFFLQAALLGLRVPQDLVLCCFTSQRAQIAHRELMRAVIPMHVCGEKAFKMLLKRIDNPKGNYKSVAVDTFRLREN